MPIGQRWVCQIKVWAPAKLNLYLEILARRPDGFHELDTIMTAISLYDTLSVRPHFDDCEIHFSLRSALGVPSSDGATVPVDESNLVVRAAKLLRDRAHVKHGARIHLVKRIPVAAGLGGASSDAAATLVACNALWQLGWSRERLAELAAELGSDIPFFIYGGTASCRGRGEVIHPVRGPRRRYFVVAKPPVGLSTADVYRRCAVPTNPRERAGTHADSLLTFNRLQPAAEQLTPWIANLQEVFSRSGALRHGMSGSGTGYFAICQNAAEALRLRSRLVSKQIGRVFYAHSDCRICARLREPCQN